MLVYVNDYTQITRNEWCYAWYGDIRPQGAIETSSDRYVLETI
jgi:hypothetical protein